MLDKDKVPEEVNVQKDLRNQMSNDIENIELFVKSSKYYHQWGGLGLMSKEFKYRQLEPLLEKTTILAVQTTIEETNQMGLLNEGS